MFDVDQVAQATEVCDVLVYLEIHDIQGEGGFMLEKLHIYDKTNALQDNEKLVGLSKKEVEDIILGFDEHICSDLREPTTITFDSEIMKNYEYMVAVYDPQFRNVSGKTNVEFFNLADYREVKEKYPELEISNCTERLVKYDPKKRVLFVHRIGDPLPDV